MSIKNDRTAAPHMHTAQTAHIISTYSADNFGVCSALYELGGMVVIHDPSGCNSTYTTHDEPRWFTKPSLFYISALTEQDAIIGNDQRIIDDITDAARRQHPRFICIIPSQIAFLIGTDMSAIAKVIQKKTGIRTFTLPTSNMTYYERGINLALSCLAGWFTDMHPTGLPTNDHLVNLLGITPLDYSVNGSLESMRRYFAGRGMTTASWTLDTSWETIMEPDTAARENIVLSYGGLGAAHILADALHIPYRVGVPIGGQFIDVGKACAASCPSAASTGPAETPENFIIGETIYAQALALALEGSGRGHFRVIIPMESDAEIQLPDSINATDEKDLQPLLETAGTVIADPLYEPITQGCEHFIPLPHEAFSGRLYRAQIPDLISPKGYQEFLERLQV